MTTERTWHFAWLDDDATRFADHKDLIEGFSGFSIKVTDIKVDQDLQEVLKKWQERPLDPAPDLFMIDQVFTKSLSLPYKMTGNTLAHLLRRQYPTTPIVCVSAAINDKTGGVEAQDFHEYVEALPYSKLLDYVPLLVSIARDYPKLAEAARDGKYGASRLIELMAAPTDEVDLLRRAIPLPFHLPSEMQATGPSFTPTLHNRMAHWVFHYFLHLPGFVYDQLHAATFLGLTEDGFRKVASRFDAAIYKGPFSTPTIPLWWQAGLRDVLYASVDPAAGPPHVAGRTLAGVEAGDFSKCYVSETTEDADLVVAQAYPNNEHYAVQRKYTEPHPDFPFAPAGFEEILVIKSE